jgi:ubiquitin-protein ligase
MVPPVYLRSVTLTQLEASRQDTGEICAAAIENVWVPTLNAKFVIESLITLMKSPNLETPLEAAIA